MDPAIHEDILKVYINGHVMQWNMAVSQTDGCILRRSQL